MEPAPAAVMPSRLSLAALLLLLAHPFGCGSVTSADDDGAPSDDAAADDDGGDPGDVSDAEDDAEDDGGDDGGDGDAPVDPSCIGASGTRLRQHVRRHSDGSSLAVGLLRDTELGFDCEFAPAADGSLRCLPAVFGPRANGFGPGRLVFTGSDCAAGPTLEVFNDPETGVPPTYVEDFDYQASGFCEPPRRRYYELGADRGVGPGQTLYATAVSGCFPFTTGNARYHAVARELPVTTFVAATRAPSETGRLGVTVIEAEDGARVCGEQSYLEDDQLGPCLPAPDEDGQLRCLTGTTEVIQATVEQCEGEPFAVARLSSECDVATTARELVGTCGGGYRVRELSGPVSEPIYEHQTCDLIDGEQSGVPPMLLGDVIDPGRFVPMGAGRIRVGERLDRMASTTEAGLVVGLDRWFDRELGVPCEFTTSVGATARCIPFPGSGARVAYTSLLYTDAGCSAEVLVAAPSGCEPDGPVPLLAYNQRAGDGVAEAFLYEVGPRREGPLFRLGDACEPVGAGEVLYGLGAKIPIDSLVTVTEDDQVE